MNERVKRLSEEIRRLSPQERAELLDEVLKDAQDARDGKSDRAWRREIERRIASYDRGEVATRDAREVLRKFRKQ
jgi:putative addiction module component (TIGR02574 family)